VAGSRRGTWSTRRLQLSRGWRPGGASAAHREGEHSKTPGSAHRNSIRTGDGEGAVGNGQEY
jgi:hypothetical protein